MKCAVLDKVRWTPLPPQNPDLTAMLYRSFLFLFISEYVNKLADQGIFQQALYEIVDLFVSKDQANKSVSNRQNNKERQW